MAVLSNAIASIGHVTKENDDSRHISVNNNTDCLLNFNLSSNNNNSNNNNNNHSNDSRLDSQDTTFGDPLPATNLTALLEYDFDQEVALTKEVKPGLGAAASNGAGGDADGEAFSVDVSFRFCVSAFQLIREFVQRVAAADDKYLSSFASGPASAPAVAAQ